MTMTKRENLLRAVRRDGPQWVPMDFEWTPEMGQVLSDWLGDVDPQEHFDCDTRMLGYIEPAIDERFIMPHCQTPEEVDAHPWEDLPQLQRFEPIGPKVRQYHQREIPVILGGANFFENFVGTRGFEQILMDLAEGNAVIRRIFERMTECEVACAEAAARTGIDIFRCSADFGTQRGPLMSVATYREYFYPMMRAVITAVREIRPDIIVFFHSCGNIEPFIEDLIELGVDILDPIQPEAMDIFELKKRFGGELCFHGGIGIQSVLREGSPQQVRDAVQRAIEGLADGGGYICAPSHTLQHDIPLANIEAFVKAVREFGVY